MRAEFGHHLRFIISFFLVSSWLIFLFATTHPTDYYLYQMAPEVIPGEIISWRNDACKLILSGWSGAEEKFRCSQNRKVGICFKPNKMLFQRANTAGVLSVTLEIAPVPELEGGQIQLSLSPDEVTIGTTLVRGRSFYTIRNQYKAIPDIACLNIILPFTHKESSGDLRVLGILLYSVAFN